MSKKEASSGIMRIGIRFGAFVVHSMVSTPVVDGTLVCDRVTKHQEPVHNLMSFVGTVRPKSMSSSCNAKTTIQTMTQDEETKQKEKRKKKKEDHVTKPDGP